MILQKWVEDDGLWGGAIDFLTHKDLGEVAVAVRPAARSESGPYLATACGTMEFERMGEVSEGVVA